jgi:hypothetical protein
MIIMVDGTLPGYALKPGDLHYDHHRPGGAKIQIDEIDLGCFAGHDQSINLPSDVTFVTTQVDADACAAAASIILASEGHYPVPELDKLRAIAFDCDHLCVPSELGYLADFAAQAVAAMKAGSDSLVSELGLPTNRREWTLEQKEQYASKAFEKGTRDLVNAAIGKAPWPGENGEAKEYWEKVEKNTQMILEEKRITEYRDCFLFDAKGLGGTYIDPRCWIKALGLLYGNQIKYYRPITLTRREVIVNNFKGISYTIGTIPLHPDQDDWDYTHGAYERLTKAEREINPNCDPWGGRATVGGSGWNTCSNLTPEQVINIVLG